MTSAKRTVMIDFCDILIQTVDRGEVSGLEDVECTRPTS